MQQFRPTSRRAHAEQATRPLLRVGIVALAVLLVSVSASALEPEVPAASGEERWLVLESMSEGFRALLPGPTREESFLRQTIAGPVQEKKYFGEENGRFFSVGLHILPKLGKWFAPTSLVLSQAKKNVLSTNGGREISYERRRMGKHPGGVLTYAPIDSSDPFDVMEVHMVLVGRRLYILKASHDEGEVYRASADRFFEIIF